MVVEYLTEGGISRFSVLFLHAPSARVGPVRSARLVTITLAQRLGAVLIYSGAGTYVEQQLAGSDVTRFIESTAGGALFRVNGRAAPHNLYTDGTRIAELLQRAHAAAITWHPWTRSTNPGSKGTPALSFSVPISLSEDPAWTYDPARRGYMRREPDSGLFIDSNTGQPVVAATVIVEQVAITPAPEVEDVNGARGVEQDVVSGGAAQVFTAGREYAGTWSQPALGLPVVTMTGGARPPIAPGLVWIELVARGSSAFVR